MDNCSLRILISDDEPVTRMDLKEMLEQAGYSVVATSSDGFDAIELCRRHQPDLALMDVKMPLLDGLSAAKIIHEENLASAVVLLTAYSDRTLIEQAKAYGVNGYLIKPIDEKALIPGIELAIARSREQEQLRREVQSVAQQLENRKTIEKAKGKLMKEEALSEQAAFDYIRNISRQKNISMKRVADLILQRG